MLPTLKISNKITIQGEFYIIKSYNVFSHNNDFYYEYCLKTGNNEIAYLADLSQIDKEIGVIFYKETNKIDTTEKPTFEVEEILLKSVSDKQIFSRKRFNCDYYKNNEEILIIKANFITINDRDFYTGLKFESQYSYKEESRFRQKSTSKKYYYKGIVLNDINSIKINESNNLNFDDLNTYNNRPIKDKLFDLKSIDDLKIGSEFYINGERLILIGINEQLFDYNINPRQIKEYNFSDVSFTNFF
ncbi:MAG: hypothetical protein MJ211_04125 [Bacteroidales bacterium]|nr:hypothetical protein [Bacteroidales bacterium]